MTNETVDIKLFHELSVKGRRKYVCYIAVELGREKKNDESTYIS